MGSWPWSAGFPHSLARVPALSAPTRPHVQGALHTRSRLCVPAAWLVAMFLDVGTHRASSAISSASVKAASRRQCRRSAPRDDRPFRNTDTATAESNSTTIRHRRVREDLHAHRTASTAPPNSFALM